LSFATKSTKGLVMTVALWLALAITGGLFAYTWVTSAATISPTAATGDFATCNAAATQPNWNSILPQPGTIGTEILRPNAAGDVTNISSQNPASGEHCDKVDEVTADDWSTYVYTSNTSYHSECTL